MECMITHNGLVKGFQAIHVKVKPASTLRRNSLLIAPGKAEKKIFKGLRR